MKRVSTMLQEQPAALAVIGIVAAVLLLAIVRAANHAVSLDEVTRLQARMNEAQARKAGQAVPGILGSEADAPDCGYIATGGKFPFGLRGKSSTVRVPVEITKADIICYSPLPPPAEGASQEATRQLLTIWSRRDNVWTVIHSAITGPPETEKATP